MDANIAAILIGIIAASPGLVALVLQWRKDKRDALKEKRKEPQEDLSDGLKVSKDAADTVITYSGELRKVRLEYETLREDIVKLRTERENDKALIAEWQYGIERLIAQIISLDHKPVWTPQGKAGI